MSNRTGGVSNDELDKSFTGLQYQSSIDGDSVNTGPFLSQDHLVRSRCDVAADGGTKTCQFSATQCWHAFVVLICLISFCLSIIAITRSPRCDSCTQIDVSHDKLLMNITAELSGVKEEKKLIQEHLKQTNESLEVIREEKRRIEEELRLNREERSELQGKIQTLNESLEEFKGGFVRIREALQRQNEEVVRQQFKMEQLNESLAMCSTNVDQLGDTLQTSERQLRSLISTIDVNVKDLNATSMKNTQELVKINTGHVSLGIQVATIQQRISKVENEQRSMSSRQSARPAINGAHSLTIELVFASAIVLIVMSMDRY